MRARIAAARALPALPALAAAAALIAPVAPAAATVTFVGSQAAFAAATSKPGIDTFDDLSANYFTTSTNRTAGSYGYTVSAPRGLDGDSNNPDQWLTVDVSDDAMTFKAFTGGVAAAGGAFFGTTASGGYIAADIVLTATDADGTVSVTLAKPAVASFAGFVSTKTITQMTAKAVKPSGGYAWVGVNDFTLATAQSPTPLPEPATWATMLLGFAAIGGITRRSRLSAAGSEQL